MNPSKDCKTSGVKHIETRNNIYIYIYKYNLDDVPRKANSITHRKFEHDPISVALLHSLLRVWPQEPAAI